MSAKQPGSNGGQSSRLACDERRRDKAMTLTGAVEAAEAASPVESLDVVARMLKDHLGAVSVSFLITDFTGSSVVRLGTADSVETGEPAQRISLHGTLYDDVIRSQRPKVGDTDGDSMVRIVAPVTNRGDTIGLLELFLPEAPDAHVMREISETAHALAYIVIANRPYTDVYQWGRRTLPLSLAAEIQHRLLPQSLACQAAQLSPANCCVSACSTARPSSSTPDTPGHCGCEMARFSRSFRTSLCHSVPVPTSTPHSHTYRMQSLDLRPGDRLVMLTDGMLERNAKNLNLSELIVRTRALHTREATRTLIEAIVGASQNRLNDDATVMCLD